MALGGFRTRTGEIQFNTSLHCCLSQCQFFMSLLSQGNNFESNGPSFIHWLCIFKDKGPFKHCDITWDYCTWHFYHCFQSKLTAQWRVSLIFGLLWCCILWSFVFSVIKNNTCPWGCNWKYTVCKCKLQFLNVQEDSYFFLSGETPFFAAVKLIISQLINKKH